MTRALRLASLAASLVLSSTLIAGAESNVAGTTVSSLSFAQSAYDWTGTYAGLQFGALNSNADVAVEAATGARVFGWPLNLNGPTAGLFVGYNRQVRTNVVFGVEAEVNWADSSDLNSIASSVGGPGGGATTEDAELDIGRTAAIRARIGYAMDRTLIYAAAGLARASYEGSVVRVVGGVPAGLPAVWSDSANGWTIGVGVEHAFADRWVGRIDYRYSDFGDLDFGPVGVAGSQVVGNLTTHELRFGLAMRF